MSDEQSQVERRLDELTRQLVEEANFKQAQFDKELNALARAVKDGRLLEYLRETGQLATDTDNETRG